MIVPIVYLAQHVYPSSETDQNPALVDSVIGVASEWNLAVKMVMEDYPHLDHYASKTKVNDHTWRIHIDGDLYVDIIKCKLNHKINPEQ